MSVLEGYTTGGYTCALCHAWVPAGTIHTCCFPPAPPAPIQLYTFSPADLTPVIAALERIAIALEALE